MPKMNVKASCYHPWVIKNCRDFQIKDNALTLSVILINTPKYNSLVPFRSSTKITEKLIASKYYASIVSTKDSLCVIIEIIVCNE